MGMIVATVIGSNGSTDIDNATDYVEYLVWNVDKHNLNLNILPDYVQNHITEQTNLQNFRSMYNTTQPYSRMLLKHLIKEVCNK